MLCCHNPPRLERFVILFTCASSAVTAFPPLRSPISYLASAFYKMMEEKVLWVTNSSGIGGGVCGDNRVWMSDVACNMRWQRVHLSRSCPVRDILLRFPSSLLLYLRYLHYIKVWRVTHWLVTRALLSHTARYGTWDEGRIMRGFESCIYDEEFREEETNMWPTLSASTEVDCTCEIYSGRWPSLLLHLPVTSLGARVLRPSSLPPCIKCSRRRWSSAAWTDSVPNSPPFLQLPTPITPCQLLARTWPTKLYIANFIYLVIYLRDWEKGRERRIGDSSIPIVLYFSSRFSTPGVLPLADLKLFWGELGVCVIVCGKVRVRDIGCWVSGSVSASHVHVSWQ